MFLGWVQHVFSNQTDFTIPILSYSWYDHQTLTNKQIVGISFTDFILKFLIEIVLRFFDFTNEFHKKGLRSTTVAYKKRIFHIKRMI